jgi:G3E family GTPase
MRLISFSGFLGVGKTTTAARLAMAYRQQGLNVWIISDERQTESSDASHLLAGESETLRTAGTCVRSGFDDVVTVLEKQQLPLLPDIVLADPACACVDIAVAVIQPLQQMFPNRLDATCCGMIAKPSHVRRILKNEASAGYSQEASSIFRKQLAEADFVALNRIDELLPAEAEELAALIAAGSPSVRVVRISAKTGEGFESPLDVLDRRGGS